ncbi:thioredoxin family protein [Puniceicoccales bacterium CK1056]|uniref:Thioredoxin family protein n=1 Tax=Oceanipulchritudo coccoides TaxID=2706888 RepID=A0A6B2LXK6_9BACT|nr:thioredoxin family protein [Oceanipulchritudo coccoides]NDV61318.1 thioredoxin family protein [Oceanipulchritudo coccoides]
MKIKSILPLIGLLLAAITVHASGEGWLTDFDKAMSQAKEKNKVILVEFHGSDWCPPCIKLNNEVLSTKAFKDLADDSLVLVDADFPRKSKLPEAQQAHNDALAKKYGVQYFPTVLLISTEGEVLDKMVGFPKGGLDGFLSFIKAKAG